MTEKYDGLLLYLSESKSIKSSTIDSLINYGFDSNETLIAMDLDEDFLLMSDISVAQKSLLRKLLSDFKQSFINNNDDENEDMSDSELLLDEIKSYFIYSEENELFESIEEIKNQIKDKEEVINICENEKICLNNKSNQLKAIINELNENIDQLYSEFKTNINQNNNYINEVKNLLLKREKRSDEEISRLNDYKKSVISLLNEELNDYLEIIESNDNNESLSPEISDIDEYINECEYQTKPKINNKIKNNKIMNKAKQTAKKLFKCNFNGCVKTFSQKVNLNRHLCLHLNLKRFRCTYRGCGASYVQLCSLKRHIRSTHKIDSDFDKYINISMIDIENQQKLDKLCNQSLDQSLKP